ncbi:MAG: T9SS type A sorting domain-containing protein [Flavobacterium sp.]|nr:T9SS type A sorting domain-containing protein [Flavobacterium sp.]
MKKNYFLVFLIIVLLQGNSHAQTSSLVSVGNNGRLVYTADAKGNVIPDFSAVGYMNSEVPIPTVGVVKTVYAVSGDNSANVQSAIDYVSTLPLNSDGFRGAILFKSGTYEINTAITINTSGIVLRGEGFEGNGTNFKFTRSIINDTPNSQDNLFNFVGTSGTFYNSSNSTRKAITDSYVPIGAKKITVASGHSFAVGDKVFVHRIPNAAWISKLGMDLLTTIDPNAVNWTPSAYDMDSERKIMAISGNIITLDAPIMDVIDPQYSSGELVKFTDNRIQNCGIENMRISSIYASPTDENHGWEAVSFDNIYNSWAKKLEVYYFGYSAVHINSHASFITVDSCKMLDAISIIDGGRRYSFNVDGQRCLVQNCTTRDGRHDYVNGSRTCGPNVFYNNTSTLQNSDIGPHHRWSTGILFDNLTGDGRMDVQNRLDMGSGHGWAGGQIMFWNCNATRMVIQDPPGDEINWAIGCICLDITGNGDATTEPIGLIQSQGTHIEAISSLFIAQLNDRITTLSSNQFDLLDTENQIFITPNPASSQITIHSNQPFNSSSKISIFNVNGQIVKKQTDIVDYSDDKLAFNIDVSDLNEGIYFAEIVKEANSKTIKFILKK